MNSEASLRDGNAPYQKVVPARFIHIDFSEKGAVQIFQDNFDQELGAKLSKTRWSIINVWRAIKPVSKDPLALCDAQSAREEDLMPVTSRLPPKGSGQYATVSAGDEFELYYKKYNEGERWYYADTMKPDEVWLIKCFDSLRHGISGRRCPHSAFTDPSAQSAANRESIEVRSLVFFEDQPV